MITSIEEIKSIEDAIEYFENKGMPLTEDEKAMLHSDFFLKKNSDKKLVKICEANKCYDGVWCEGKDYCEVHQNEQEKLQSLVQQKFPSLSNPQEVIRFETWWNKNLGTVIDGDYSYTLWLVVYEPAQRSMNEILEKFEISVGYDKYSLDSAKSKAKSLRRELNGENPILSVHPNANSYESFNEWVKNPYVHTIYLPDPTKDIEIETYGGFSCACYPACDCWNCDCRDDERIVSTKIIYHDPEEYLNLKPLDMVWGKRSTMNNDFYHVVIYLGNGKICHYSGKDKKQYEAKIMITDWENFAKKCVRGEAFAFRSIIPFRHYRQIAQEIDWANNNNYWEGRYCLANNNCEHRINSFIYGINYSKQVQESSNKSANNCQIWRGRCWGDCKRGISNNNKSSINLSNEINQTNNQLNKSNGHWYNEIKNQYEAKAVSQSKDCKIM